MLPRLQAIVDVDVAARAGWDPVELAQAYLAGGAQLLQLRAKTLPSADLLALADALVAAAAPYDAQVLINDRVDVARLANASGVHVGQDDVPPAEARRLLGESAIVGYSTHSVSQVRAALLEPVSYIAVGPVFGTQTKNTGYDAVGLDLVSAAADAARTTTDVARMRVVRDPIPIVAIGGITLDTAVSVLQAGASAVAVISDLLVGDPVVRTRAYLQALASHRV